MTPEQISAIETMKQEGITDTTARAEFANKVLATDGTVSTDTVGMVAATKAAVQKHLSEGSETEHLEKATAASRKVREVEEHLEQGRFLFVVDEDGIPLVYFQCAVAGNPDTGR